MGCIVSTAMYRERDDQCMPNEWFVGRLLLDFRVLDLPMAYNPIFVILSSLKPLFFNSLKNGLCFSDNMGA